jgi:capsular exopolysaccharide synthesis family protein
MLNQLISLNNPKAKASEAFRTLRTNLQFSSVDDTLKSILVTSSMPSEGKSTIMANLGITYAQADKKVLILDCDLRRPSIHKQFEISNSKGLTNLLIDASSLEDYIFTTEMPNLYVIPSGPIPPNPSDLLGTKRMRLLLAKLQDLFDLILIDAPPVIAVTDAQILSTMADGVIIITSYGEVEKGALAKTKMLLDMVGARMLGLVLNKVPDHSKHHYYKKDYYAGA